MANSDPNKGMGFAIVLALVLVFVWALYLIKGGDDPAPVPSEQPVPKVSIFNP